MQRTEVLFYQGVDFITLYTEHIDHPYEMKVNFLFGELKILMGSEVFTAELYSNICLNQGVEWDRKFFEELRANIQRGAI